MSDRLATPKYHINPEAKVLGAAILSLTISQNKYDFQDLMEKYDYCDVDPQGWYSYTDVMNFLRDLAARHNNTQNMVSIGIKVFDVLPIPESVESVADGLKLFSVMMDAAEKHVIRDNPWYTVEVVDDYHIILTDNGPLPHDLIYGEVYGLVHRLRPASTMFSIRRKFLNEENPDADGAILYIDMENV